MRLTTRRLMLLIGAVALVLGLRMLAEPVEWLDEPLERESRTLETWDLGPTPTVFVDCFEGTIHVTPATDGRVTAQIRRIAVAEKYRSAAEEGLRSISTECNAHNDTLRIAARGASEPLVRKEVRVSLQVPPNTRFDLRTGRGVIVVGWTSGNPTPTCVPIVSPSIRARNDSPGRSNYADGNIEIACRASQLGDAQSNTTRLQLEAAGRVEVDADRATVEARLWQGAPPSRNALINNQGNEEGTVQIRGKLLGENTIRATHGIELHLPSDAACRVEAEAHRGDLIGNVFPISTPTQFDVSHWSGLIGDNPTATLRLRTDDGPIQIDGAP